MPSLTTLISVPTSRNTHSDFWQHNIQLDKHVCVCLPRSLCCVCVKLSVADVWCGLALVLRAHVSHRSVVSNSWVFGRIPAFSPDPALYSAPDRPNSSQTHISTGLITGKQRVCLFIMKHDNTHRDSVIVIVQDVVQSLQISVFFTECQLESSHLAVFFFETAKLLIDRILDKHTIWRYETHLVVRMLLWCSLRLFDFF